MTNPQKPSQTLLFVLAAVGAGFIFCLGITAILMARNFSVVIAPDERGLVISLGQPTGEILEPGLHFLPPSQEVVIIYIGQQTYTTVADSGEPPDLLTATTSDGEKIYVDISAVYAVDPEQLVNLYIAWQDHYTQGLVRPLIRLETLDTLSEYPFAEISQHQAEIEQITFDELNQLLAKQGLILVEYDILDIREISPTEGSQNTLPPPGGRRHLIDQVSDVRLLSTKPGDLPLPLLLPLLLPLSLPQPTALGTSN